jgi:hypothetical protein
MTWNVGKKGMQWGNLLKNVPLQDQEGDGKITSSWISGRQTVRLRDGTQYHVQ